METALRYILFQHSDLARKERLEVSKKITEKDLFDGRGMI